MQTNQLSNRNNSLGTEVLDPARVRFKACGYEAVGMRDIARAVGKQPVQIYRHNLSEADIAARGLTIWALDSIGYRQAVAQSGRAEEYLAVTRPSRRFHLATPALH